MKADFLFKKAHECCSFDENVLQKYLQKDATCKLLD